MRGGGGLRGAALDEDGEASRRGVAQQRAHAGVVGQACGIQAHAEGRFHRVVPARLHVDRLPQPLRALEVVGLDPVLELRVGVELRLLRGERGERGLEPRELARRLVQARGGGLALLLEQRDARLGLALLAFEPGDARAFQRALGLHRAQLVRLREDQRHVLLLEAVLARLDLGEELQRVGFARLLDALRLLRGAHLRLGGAHRIGRRAGGGLGGRYRLACLRRLGFPRRDGRARRVDLRLPALALALCLGHAPLDFGGLRAERLELRAHAPAVLAQEVDLLLERLHLRVGRVERALQRLELVGLLVMAAA